VKSIVGGYAGTVPQAKTGGGPDGNSDRPLDATVDDGNVWAGLTALHIVHRFE
jgi:hypothetical protein